MALPVSSFCWGEFGGCSDPRAPCLEKWLIFSAKIRNVRCVSERVCPGVRAERGHVCACAGRGTCTWLSL